MRRIAIAIVIAVLLPGIAAAQSQRNLTGNPIQDIKNKIDERNNSGGGTAVAAVPAFKPLQDLAAFIGDDIDEAIRLSTAIDGMKDGHGQQCLIGLRDLGAVIKQHPTPVSFRLASDLEALRLQQMAINKLCSNVHCTQVFGDVTNFIQSASPIPLPIPSLHDICAKIPQIAVADPIDVPASTSTPPAPPQTTPAPSPNPTPP